MTDYLLHQKRDGSPIGVFTQTNHFYLAGELDKHEAYGAEVVGSKGPDTSWAEWIEQLASKSPSPTAMWDVYQHAPAPLETVLMDARKDTN